MAAIYQIRNLENNKVYIGSAKEPFDRWSQHQSLLKINQHHSNHLQRAWNLYGFSFFVFEILETCCNSIQFQQERFWILKKQSHLSDYGYNMVIPEITGGYEYTEEMKKRNSDRVKQQYQKKKELGVYKIVVIDFLTEEKEYFLSSQDYPKNFTGKANFKQGKFKSSILNKTNTEIIQEFKKYQTKYKKYLNIQHKKILKEKYKFRPAFSTKYPVSFMSDSETLVFNSGIEAAEYFNLNKRYLLTHIKKGEFIKNGLRYKIIT